MATVDDRAIGRQGSGRVRPARGRSGMVGPSRLQHRGGQPVRPGGVGPPDGGDQGRAGAGSSSSRPTARSPGRGASSPPTSWSSKYFYGEINTPERETSVRQLVDRVTRTIADWGREDGYFATAEDAERFYDELTAPLPEPVRLVQLAGLVQRRPLPPLRDRRARPTTGGGTRRPGRSSRPTSAYQYPAGLGLLHPERRRRHAGHHAAGDLRGDALQVRLGHRHRPLDPPLEPGEALRRRQALRARSASCGSTTRSPASSSRAARPAAPPRCRPSRSGTPTSSNSSSARPRRRRRPRP